jgi:hypothetical protein
MSHNITSGAFLALLLTLPVSVINSSCSSIAANPQGTAAALRISVGVGASLALNNNPKYAPAVAALAQGIDAAISQSATINPAQITAYVNAVCLKYGVKPVDVAIFDGLALSIYQMYVTTYKPAVVSSTDPTVLLYVNAFKDGLNDALGSFNTATAMAKAL